MLNFYRKILIKQLDLITFIDNCSYDDKTQKSLFKGRNLTLQKHYYKFPGKSSNEVYKTL